MDAKGSPKVPKVSEREPAGPPKGATWRPMGAKREPKMAPGVQKVSQKQNQIDALIVTSQKH